MVAMNFLSLKLFALSMLGQARSREHFDIRFGPANGEDSRLVGFGV